jgi:uncharacterized coiled-coil protein SlyX
LEVHQSRSHCHGSVRDGILRLQKDPQDVCLTAQTVHENKKPVQKPKGADGTASRRTRMTKTKNKTVKTDTETINKISDFVWELSTEMDAIREQMEDLQIRMLSIRKMLQIMENPKNK